MSVIDPRWLKGGYAHFPGSYAGDEDRGLTCFRCAHLRPKPGQIIDERMYSGFCAKAAEFAGHPSAPIVVTAPACKYWEKRT